MELKLKEYAITELLDKGLLGYLVMIPLLNLLSLI